MSPPIESITLIVRYTNGAEWGRRFQEPADIRTETSHELTRHGPMPTNTSIYIVGSHDIGEYQKEADNADV